MTDGKQSSGRGRSGFRTRVFLAAFVGVHAPLLAALAYLLWPGRAVVNPWILVAVLFATTLLGTVLLLWYLHRSTRPLLEVHRELQAYLEKHYLGGFSAEGRDELSELVDGMREALATIEEHRRQLTTQATHDFLTGLYNRRIAEEHLENNCKLARRTGTPLCVALLDLDGFKDANDAHGHEVGDEVLREIARRIRDQLRRESDWVARWGGDEFLLAVFAPVIEARSLFEDIRHCIAVEPIRARGLNLHLTASIGVVPFQPEDTPDSLLRWADKLLYKAKSLGRNRVEFAE